MILRQMIRECSEGVMSARMSPTSNLLSRTPGYGIPVPPASEATIDNFPTTQSIRFLRNPIDLPIIVASYSETTTGN